MGVLAQLEPQDVFHFFEEISAVPRSSGQTEAIRDYLVEFAKDRDLEYVADEGGNVLIRSAGTTGYENADPVILQGHMDMVAVKKAGCEHDFATQGLDLAVEDDDVLAEGTSLGGDDGIALAYMLALMDTDEIPHPPLECVFTTDEEIGLLGAAAFDAKQLKGRRMINLDSENEGILTCGCAGGSRVDTILPIHRVNQKGLPVMVTFYGLKGGHSGQEIDRGRLNADKLAGRFLYELSLNAAFSLASVSGGEKDNAIPAESKVRIVLDEEDFPVVEQVAKKFEATVKNEYRATDGDVAVKLEKGNVHRISVLDLDSQDRVIFFLMHDPNGVRRMSSDISGLVQTSSNLGIVRTGEQEFAAVTSVRSAVASERDMLVSEIRSLSEFLGGSISERGQYPAWEYRQDSPLRDTMIKAWHDLFGEDPEVDVIHAGLECGLFYEKIRGLDAVSIGPEIRDIHTYDERLSVSSTARTWEFLKQVLAALK